MFRKHFKRLVNRYEKTGVNRYVYDFSADYDVTSVDDIKNVQKIFDEEK